MGQTFGKKRFEHHLGQPVKGVGQPVEGVGQPVEGVWGWGWCWVGMATRILSGVKVQRTWVAVL